MAWEERNGRHYFYRKVWTRGSCQSNYVGCGEFAQAIATLEEHNRQQRAYERDVWRAEVEAPGRA